MWQTIEFIKSHYYWKALKLEICLQVVESHKFGFELRKKYDMKRYKVIWLWSVLADILVLQVQDQDQTQR